MRKIKLHRLISLCVAAVMVFAIALTGSHAWQSINQEALNETHTVINPGGRLHDDFDGKNKDVYVENFTDPDNGGVPIFARIRLDEYMEIGPDAGINRLDADRDVTILGRDDLGNESDINDVTSWSTHIPDIVTDICTNGNPDTFHDYWGWDMGGSTVYMPTFNKNKDSLEADINGTYANQVDADGDGTVEPYEDNRVYAAGAEQTGFEIWDMDTDTADDLKGNVDIRDVIHMDPVAVGTVEGSYADHVWLNKGDNDKGVAHTARQTLEAAVVTMQQWIELGCPVGSYWVYDKDGWAYWAAPIEPGTATGLLLDGIHMDREPNKDCYYAINVVAQFATRGDWGDAVEGTGFYDKSKGEPPTEDALFLLNQAAGMKPTVTLTGAGGRALPESVTADSTAQLEAELTLSGKAFPDQRVVWSVSGLLPLDAGTTIDENGLLTVSADEDPENVLVVKAVSVANPRAYASVNIPVD